MDDADNFSHHMSGWVKKESEVLKSWNSRYFILLDKFIFYSKSEKDCVKRPLGVIQLHNSICNAAPNKHEFAFQISYHNDVIDKPTNYYILCASINERDSWINAIKSSQFIFSLSSPRGSGAAQSRCLDESDLQAMTEANENVKKMLFLQVLTLAYIIL